MPRIILPALGIVLLLSACVIEDTDRRDDPRPAERVIVEQRACVRAAERRGLRVVRVSAPQSTRNRNGDLVSRRFVLGVREGRIGYDVLCIYNVASRSAVLSRR